LQQRIGIMGGTFNPVHYGHLAAAEEVRQQLSLDRILFVPAFIPPHKQEERRPTAAERRDMVRLAIAGNPNFDLSDVELARGGTSYTIDTLRHLHSSHPNALLFFITGLDSFLDIRTWHQWEHLFVLCAFVILSRPGYRFLDLTHLDFMKSHEGELLSLDRGAVAHSHIRALTCDLYLQAIPRFDISATDIRARVREGRSIKYHLPESVEHYIIEKKLYV
jgi:nicotinate-nucleotide adenylyltransferase